MSEVLRTWICKLLPLAKLNCSLLLANFYCSLLTFNIMLTYLEGKIKINIKYFCFGGYFFCVISTNNIKRPKTGKKCVDIKLPLLYNPKVSKRN